MKSFKYYGEAVKLGAKKSRPKIDRNIDFDVHTRHCCKIHGCKYGDGDCTVTTTAYLGLTGSCEHCWWDNHLEGDNFGL